MVSESVRFIPFGPPRGAGPSRPRHEWLKVLGLRDDVQVSAGASRRIEECIAVVSAQIVRAVVDAFDAENDARSPSSRPLRRIMPRHVERAREALGIEAARRPKEAGGDSDD